jgi:hypothetical protein
MSSGRSLLGGRQSATGSSRTTVTVIVASVLVVALLVIGGIAALVRSGGDDAGSSAAGTGSTPAASPSASPSPTAASPSASSPASTPTKTAKKAAKTKKSSAGQGTANASGSPGPRTYSGSGNAVLKIKKPRGVTGPALVVARHPGTGSFGVLALDAAMDDAAILVNVAGPYHGTTLLDGQGTQTQHLRIRAKGPWTLAIKPVTAARPVSMAAKGTTDEVLQYSGPAGRATFDCLSGLRFVVSYVAESSTTVLVNKVGSYHGQVHIKQGPALIAVQAGAAWKMQVGP